jgi:hypothetical protein
VSTSAVLSNVDLEAQLEEVDRQQGVDSIFYLGKFILGYDEMDVKPHVEVCEFLEDVVRGGRLGLDLEPRGSFKTTQISQTLPISLLLRNPNLRILLDSAVLQNSIDNLGVIKRHFEGNERFRYLFGDYIGGHWTTEEITISKRTKNLKEPSIRCASVERVQVGPHYDVIIPDDLVSEENSKTQDGRKQVKDHFRLLFSLLEPGGIMILAGTRWHFDDLYGMIIDEEPTFAKRIMCAGGVNCPHGKPLYFEKRLTDSFLSDKKLRQKRDIYNCQYENDPAPDDAEAKFQKGWFKTYDRLPERRYGFIAIDPGGEKKKSDEWAIMCAYVDEANYLYFDRLVVGNFKTSEAWDILFDLVDVVKPLTIGLETTGGQKYLVEGLQAEMRRRSRFLNIQELPHAGDSKEYRILNLQPRYRAGAILHSKQMGALEDQLRRFPKGKDDVADVASMILEICMAPAKRRVDQKPKTLDEALMQAALKPKHEKKRHSMLGSEW